VIRRCPRPTGNFCVINNDVINDQRLSWDSRATLLYLLSKPDHWTVSIANLVNQTLHAIRVASGRDAVYGMLRELMIARYVKRVQLRSEDGTMAGVEYVVSELPFEDAEIGDDFLPQKQAGKRRQSRATSSRSFSAATAAEYSPASTVDATWAPVDVTPPRVRVVAVDEEQETPSRAVARLDCSETAGSSTNEVRAETAENSTVGVQASESAGGGGLAVTQDGKTQSANASLPLTGKPETAKPDPANTTQVKTHSKKERSGSKDLKARSRPTQPRQAPQPRPRSTGRAPQIELFDAQVLVARGVDPKVAATWLAVRAKKRAVNSMLALDGVQEQAVLAGMTLGEAVKVAAERSWQGFCADWVKRGDGPSGIGPRRPPRSGAQMTEQELAESMRRAKAELFGDSADGPAGNWREPTLLDRDGDMWRAPS